MEDRDHRYDRDGSGDGLQTGLCASATTCMQAVTLDAEVERVSSVDLKITQHSSDCHRKDSTYGWQSVRRAELYRRVRSVPNFPAHATIERSQIVRINGALFALVTYMIRRSSLTGYIRSYEKHELARLRVRNGVLDELHHVRRRTLWFGIAMIKTEGIYKKKVPFGERPMSLNRWVSVLTVAVFDSSVMNIALWFECDCEKIMTMATVSNDEWIVLFIFQQTLSIHPTERTPIPADLREENWTIPRLRRSTPTSFSLCRLANWAIIGGLSWLSNEER